MCKQKLSFPAAPAPALSLDSTAERTLLTEAGVSSPENMNLGDPDLSLVCHKAAWGWGEETPLHPSVPETSGRVGKSRRAAFTPHQLQHMREQALYLSSAAQ